MAKLNREEILHGLLQTLVDGWGASAVRAALDELGQPETKVRRKTSNANMEAAGPTAIELVSEMDVSTDRKIILTELATRFDAGTAFPKIGDVRSFLSAHHRNGSDIKGRTLGFKRMLPVLVAMSPKGLEKLIARSHHSGPADLSEISDAIRGAGEHLRGSAPQTIGEGQPQEQPDSKNDLFSSEATPKQREAREPKGAKARTRQGTWYRKRTPIKKL